MPLRKKPALNEVSARQAEKDIERGGRLMEKLTSEPGYDPEHLTPEHIQRTHKILNLIAGAQGRQRNMQAHGNPYNRVENRVRTELDKVLAKGRHVLKTKAGRFEFKKVEAKHVPEIEKKEYVGFVLGPRFRKRMRKRNENNPEQNLLGKLKNGHWVFLPSKYL